MNSDIRFLQQLDDDLADAAHRENEREAKRSSGNDEPPPRLPRRGGGRRWGQAAAAVVAILVLAGSIGFLAQGSGSSGDSGADGGGAQASKAAPGLVAPNIAPEKEVNRFGVGNDEQIRDQSAEFASLSGNGGSGGSTDTRGNSVDLVGEAPGAQQDLSKIIRDGRIEVVVPNGEFGQHVTAVSRIAGNNGGFVLSSSTVDGRSGTFTLRIPARRFELAMNQLRELGTVKLDQITGEDVTAEFIDLQARLEILTDRRELLRELQAEATSSGEILRFAGLIDNVEFEIEKLQGNLNFIKNQVAEATIKVGLREQDAPESENESPSDIDNPSLAEAFDYAAQGFLRVLGAVVVGLGYLIPLGALAFLGWALYRLVRRRGRAED